MGSIPLKKERFCCQLTQYCQKETVLFCFHGGIIFIINVSFTQPSRLRLRPLLSACPVRKALPPLCRARPCMGSCKGRYKLAGPKAAYFAALGPLRDYPSDKQKRLKSFPCKDPCMALPGKGAEGPFEQGRQITAGADAGAKVV